MVPAGPSLLILLSLRPSCVCEEVGCFPDPLISQKAVSGSDGGLIEEVRVNTGVGMNEDALGGMPLRAVAGDSIAVVEMRMLAGIELNPATIAQ